VVCVFLTGAGVVFGVAVTHPRRRGGIQINQPHLNTVSSVFLYRWLVTVRADRRCRDGKKDWRRCPRRGKFQSIFLNSFVFSMTGLKTATLTVVTTGD